MAVLLDRMKPHLDEAKGVICIVVTEDGEFIHGWNIARLGHVEAIGALEAVKYYLHRKAYD